MKKLILYFILIVISSLNSFAIDDIEEYVEKNKLYESFIWKSLLHYRNEQPSIFNKDFLLSYDNFSLKNELVQTIKAIKDENNYLCKYPARYEWLKKDLSNLNIKIPNIEVCDEFNKYLNKTNLETIDLIFVSENVKNPSSMMGHVFFNLKSKKDKNTKMK